MNELPFESELEFRQLNDPRIKEISENLEYKEDNKFDMINGLIYRKDGENRKFVVPESMVKCFVSITWRIAHWKKQCRVSVSDIGSPACVNE